MSLKLKDNQIQAARLLASGVKSIDVAKQLGVTPETVSRWRRSIEFQAQINEVQADAHDDALNVLRSLSFNALSVLQEQLTNTDAPPKVRLDAAQAVLRFLSLGLPSSEVIGPTTPQALRELNEAKNFAQQNKLYNGV